MLWDIALDNPCDMLHVYCVCHNQANSDMNIFCVYLEDSLMNTLHLICLINFTGHRVPEFTVLWAHNKLINEDIVLCMASRKITSCHFSSVFLFLQFFWQEDKQARQADRDTGTGVVALREQPDKQACMLGFSKASRVLVFEALWPQGSANSQEWKSYANTVQRM